MEAYSIKNLNFKYPDGGQFALKNINLDIHSGEILLICGASGCGKTTLLNHLKTVMTPYGERSGDISFFGQPLSEISNREQAEKIGYVLQDPANSQVTDKVWHEMAFGAENLGLSRDEMKRRISETANFFGIDKWYHREIYTLSGGQKQLLNLASVMVMQPKVLILDEPTASLDPVAANEFLNALYRINSELGTTIVLTEHRTQQVMSHRHRILFMDCGEIKFCHSPHQLSCDFPKFSRYLPISAQVAGAFSAKKLPLDVRAGRNWLQNFTADFKNKTNINTEKDLSDTYSIKLNDVFYRYSKDGQDILKGCSLFVPEGCVYAVLGGNGSGKSTLLKVIAGMQKRYSGKVFTDGRAVYLPQDVRLMFSKDTVIEEIREISNGSIEKIIELCQLENILNCHPYDISVGQAQRVGLAKLLATGAKILLLDEVTRGIDPVFKDELGEMLKKLSTMGMTIVIVSHDIEFCSRYADRVGMFFDGEICSEGTPAAFFANNNFYTTQAVRMSRDILNGCVNREDIINLCKKNI